MTNNASRTLVLGATGRVGGATIRELMQRGVSGIVAGVRDPGRARATLPEGVEIRRLDLDDAGTLPGALSGVRTAMLLTGYSVDMLVQSQRFLHAASDAGVRHVVHLGASGSATHEVAHWGWHRYVEALIERLGFDWTHLRPEAFLQNITDFGWFTGDTLTSYIGASRWSWVDADDVASMAAAVLAEPGRFRGRVIPLGYDAKSIPDIAGMLSVKLGHEVSVVDREPGEFLSAALEAGADPAYMACVARQFELNRRGLIPDADATFDGFERIVGRAPTRAQTFIDRLDVSRLGSG